MNNRIPMIPEQIPLDYIYPEQQKFINIQNAKYQYNEYRKKMTKKFVTMDNVTNEEMIEFFKKCHRIDTAKEEDIVRLVNSLNNY